MVAGDRRTKAGSPRPPLALGTLVLFALLGFPHPASPRTWHIQSDGSGDAPTVQAGIDSAAVGDTVLVGPGTYLENLSIVGKDLVLKSDMGPEATILDGSSQQETVIYLSGQTRAMVVEGFTITHGVGHLRGTVLLGGGLYLDNGASPSILKNAIRENGLTGVTYGAGGLMVNTTVMTPASPLIQENTWTSNTARLGGAMAIGYGTTEIRGNIFRENTCAYDGGAIYAVINSGSVIIEGNQFWDNYAGDHGGALDIGGTSASEVLITWNLFIRNEALGLGTGDTGSGGAMHVALVRGSIVNNTIVEGIGPSGQTSCGGGGISLEYASADLNISDNIIAFNSNCGIACRLTIENPLGRNLFWMNQGGDLGSGLGECPSEWAGTQLFANPYFCSPRSDDYRLAANSPAIGMGAFPDPACPPVAVRSRTWGRLKSLYR